MDSPLAPKSLVIQRWMKSGGVLLLAVAAGLGTLTSSVSLDTVNDGQSESECRSNLANAVTRMQGEINTVGWTALLDAYAGAPPEETAKSAADLRALISDLDEAQERRDRADEICQEG